MKSTMHAVRAAVVAATLLTMYGCSLQSSGGKPAPTGYALIYGISDYNPPGPSYKDLTVCDDDAMAMGELFGAQGYTVSMKLNGNVTKNAVRSDFAAAAAALKPGDTFVMYYSGHGDQFVIPGNAEASTAVPVTEEEKDAVVLDPDLLEEAIVMSDYLVTRSVGDLLSDDELAALFATIPAVKKLLILDSCRSGGFVGQGPALDTNPQDYKGERGWDGNTLGMLFDYFGAYTGTDGADLTSSGTIVLTAAGEREESYEITTSPYRHGVFTYYVLEGARKGDADLDGYVSVTELFLYASDRIQSDWNVKNTSARYLPRISGTPFDFMLFVPAQ